MPEIKIGDIDIDVIYKDIKNVHLGVYPPAGRVRISAPLRMKPDVIRVFAISKLAWIKKQQCKFQNQDRETARDYISRESHYFLGKRYLLNLIERNSPPEINLNHDAMEMYVRPDTDNKKRQSILNEWYRMKLKEIVPAIIARYEKKMKVKINNFGIRKMKTKWGTCNPDACRIWLNLELARKPLEYIEYIIVHEMTHLIERHHNEVFIAYMNKFMPKWKFYREELNRGSLRQERWE